MANNYFIKNGHRYAIVRSGMESGFAKDRLKARKKLAPDFSWATKKGSDGTYRLGRR